MPAETITRTFAETTAMLIVIRDWARKKKNWKLADAIRNELEQNGVYLTDIKRV